MRSFARTCLALPILAAARPVTAQDFSDRFGTAQTGPTLTAPGSADSGDAYVHLPTGGTNGLGIDRRLVVSQVANTGGAASSLNLAATLPPSATTPARRPPPRSSTAR